MDIERKRKDIMAVIAGAFLGVIFSVIATDQPHWWLSILIGALVSFVYEERGIFTRWRGRIKIRPIYWLRLGTCKLGKSLQRIAGLDDC